MANGSSVFAKCPSINAGAAEHAARTNFKIYLRAIVAIAESARVTRQSQWTHEEEKQMTYFFPPLNLPRYTFRL